MSFRHREYSNYTLMEWARKAAFQSCHGFLSQTLGVCYRHTFPVYEAFFPLMHTQACILNVLTPTYTHTHLQRAFMAKPRQPALIFFSLWPNELRGGTLCNTCEYSRTWNLDVGGSNMETVESASGFFRVVPPAVELHRSASIDEANRFVFLSLFPHSSGHTLCCCFLTWILVVIQSVWKKCIHAWT